MLHDRTGYGFFSATLKKQINIIIVLTIIIFTPIDLIFATSFKTTILNGEIRDNIIFVPARAISKSLGAKILWGGDIRNVVIVKDEIVIRLTFGKNPSKFLTFPDRNIDVDLPALLLNGQTHVPLYEVCEALGAKVEYDELNRIATVIKEEKKIIVYIIERTILPSNLEDKELELLCYKFLPSADPNNYDTESDSKTIEVIKKFNPKKTAVMIIDFWGERDVDSVPFDNTASLIFLARKYAIPVIHFPHAELNLPGYRMNPRILPIPDNEPVLQSELVEDYFPKNNMDIELLLVAGYGTAECLLFTRPNSINQLSRRTNKFDIVIVKDATSSKYWQYLFAINGIETKFHSTTLDNLSRSLGDNIKAVPYVPDGYFSSPAEAYHIDTDFGNGLEFDKTVLVLINIWDYHENDGWLSRIKNNNMNNVLPLLQFARSNGMKIIHVSNNRKIDLPFSPIKGKETFSNLDDIKKYLDKHKISTIIYAGNLINTTPLFVPIDVWGFTRDNFQNIRTRILEDCITVFETPESLRGQHFKSIFLERATAYTGNEHRVSRFSILRRNSDLLQLQPNEKYHIRSENIKIKTELASIKIITNSLHKQKHGAIILSGSGYQIVIPSELLKGRSDIFLTQSGNVRTQTTITGGSSLLAESLHSPRWKTGYRNIAFGKNTTEDLEFRFESFYPIHTATIELQTSNCGDREDNIASISVSYDRGKSYNNLGEKRSRYTDGKLFWYLTSLPIETQTIYLKVSLPRMNNYVGIYGLSITTEGESDKLKFDPNDNSLELENQTNVSIKIEKKFAFKIRTTPSVEKRVP